VPDVDAARGGGGGVVAQRHGLAHERSIELEEPAVEADGVVALHAALGLEEEQLVEVEPRIEQARRLFTLGPALQRREPVQSPVRAVVVLALDPGPQPAVESFEAGGVGLGQGRQQLGAYGAEPTFLLALPLGLVGPGMDQCYSQPGAHQGKLLRAVAGPVVHVQALHDASA
jgi:hypothetical protein